MKKFGGFMELFLLQELTTMMIHVTQIYQRFLRMSRSLMNGLMTSLLREYYEIKNFILF